MKVVLTSCLFFLQIVSANAQTVSRNAGTGINVTGAGSNSWSTTANATGAADGTTSNVTLNNGNRESNFLVLTNFGFIIPAGSTITGITASISRNASRASQVEDIEIRLVKNNVIETAEDKAVSGAWPTTLTAATYGSATDLWSSSWSLTEIQATGFGIAIRSRKTGGGAPVTASVDAVSITINYNLSTPILLTKFDVEKIMDNKVIVRWTTSSEENVKFFQVQRSVDGMQFESIFTITPKGDKNLESSYMVTDPAPLPGVNFYRLYEMDLDGQAFYFQIRQVNISGTIQRFKVLNTGYAIRLLIDVNPGRYEAVFLKSNGSIVKKQLLDIAKFQPAIDIPYNNLKPGIYYIQFTGKGIKETEAIFIGNY